MFIDNLTLTAIGFFVVGLLCTVRFCIFDLCGGPHKSGRYDDPSE